MQKSTPAPKRFLEDFTVGEVFETASVGVNATEILTFAESFDPQPFHLDEAAARAGFFGGLVASGWHTGALTMRLFVESGVMREIGVIGFGVQRTALARAGSAGGRAAPAWRGRRSAPATTSSRPWNRAYTHRDRQPTRIDGHDADSQLGRSGAAGTPVADG